MGSAKHLVVQSEILPIGGYCAVSYGKITTNKTEHRQLYNRALLVKGTKYDDYFGLINIEELDALDEQVLFSHVNTISLDISTYDANTSSKIKFIPNRNTEVDKTTIVTTHFNVQGSSVDIILNLTDHPVIVYDRNNIPKVHMPIRNPILKSKYPGSTVLIFSRHTLNNPWIVSSTCNSADPQDYLNVLINRFSKTNGEKYNEALCVAKFAKYMYEVYSQEEDKLAHLQKSSALVILTCSAVDMGALDAQLYSDTSKYSAIYVKNKGYVLTYESIFKNNSVVAQDYEITNTDLYRILRKIGTFCFIVDRKNKLTNKYYYNFGQAVVVPKIEEETLLSDGLYRATVDEDFKLSKELVCSLDDINSVDWLYNSEEECIVNSSEKFIKAKYESSHEKEIAQYRVELEKQKLKNEGLKLQLATKEKELELEYKQKMKELDEEYQARKRKMETDSMHSKMEYENKKYERDHIIESIKLGVSIAAIIASAIAIIKKN